jgi:hypothetical protein
MTFAVTLFSMAEDAILLIHEFAAIRVSHILCASIARQ